MNKVVYYSVFLVFGAAMLSVVACSHNDLDERIVESTSTLEVYGGINALTRAVDQTWSVGDQIGVMGGDYLNACYVLDETEATNVGHFSAAEDHTIYVGGSGAINFTAYSPYQTSNGAFVYPGQKVDGVVTVSTASQSSVEDQEAIDFLYASAQSASSDSPRVNFTFTHQMAKLVLKVVYGEGLSAAILQYDDNEFVLGGLIHGGTFDVTDGTTNTEGTATDSWDLNSCSVKEDIDDGVQFTAIILPQNPSLAITVKVNDEEFDETALPVPDGGFTAGKAYTYPVTINENGLIVGTADEGCIITAWDELGGDEDEDYQVSIGGN
ncbi:MAG: fimbrillin family protein [Prevotellaceae bacterium]|nr:fimbrillin family protein [Prevotellaceae bacterium]